MLGAGRGHAGHGHRGGPRPDMGSAAVEVKFGDGAGGYLDGIAGRMAEVQRQLADADAVEPAAGAKEFIVGAVADLHIPRDAIADRDLILGGRQGVIHRHGAACGVEGNLAQDVFHGPVVADREGVARRRLGFGNGLGDEACGVGSAASPIGVDRGAGRGGFDFKRGVDRAAVHGQILQIGVVNGETELLGHNGRSEAGRAEFRDHCVRFLRIGEIIGNRLVGDGEVGRVVFGDGRGAGVVRLPVISGRAAIDGQTGAVAGNGQGAELLRKVHRLREPGTGHAGNGRRRHRDLVAGGAGMDSERRPGGSLDVDVVGGMSAPPVDCT